MTSSMLAGERRWASSRRSSMTVLGKVAVPKPLNLPSQRLENHGLNPDVEIVPKGTLSWGSQSSSSATNAWGNSSLLTKTDGGASSPSQLSGRPSSGSGTRPSTAGSDKTHETTNAWSQNSRPSSASGALTSNQTALTSLRPRSAETRPGSSQLSRFAGAASDNSPTWGPGNVSEKLGVASSRSDGFSLSSGDFPTLGSERDNSGRNADPQEHGSYGRPVSSSGTAASEKEKGDISVNTNIKSGTVGGWRRDGPQHVEDVPQTTAEKLHGDPPPHLNANVLPQHFDAWHGPPVNAPPGVWYRGPPGGPPPYGTPLAPGGFPIEPFPYFRPQVPPGALANSQPVPPPGIGPRGHHPKTGDLYRPHIPDAYIRPGMPIRPGFYPGPMPYEGYYGPPMGYFNSSERDVPFMGMAAGPSMYHAPDPANNHVRASVPGPMVKTPVPEQAETAAPDENRRPYKVLLKQHNHSDEKLAENKWEHVVPGNVPHLEKGDQPRTSLHKSEWGLEESKDEVVYSGSETVSEDACSRNFANQGTSSDLKDKLTGNRGKGNAVNESSVNRSDIIVPTSAGVPQVYPATPKETTLLQKIEGLNAKARASDGRPGAVSMPGREEQKDRLQLADAMASCSTNEMVTVGLCSEKSQATSHEVDFSAEDMSLRPADSSGTAISRRSSHVAQGRFDHRGKRFNTRDGDGWRKKPLATEPIREVSAANSEPSPSVHVCYHPTSVDGGVEKSGFLQGSDEKESLTTVFDANDCQVQRAKKREMAKQRAEQLQKEEEERTREQKARALAKLEELNQRTQTVDGSSLKLENALPTDHIQQEQEGSQILPEPVTVAGKSGAPAFVSYSNAQIIESCASVVGEFTAVSNNILLELSGNVHPEPVVSLDQLPSLPQDARTAGAADCKAGSQVCEGNVSRHKRLGYKQKQNVPSGKNLADKPVPVNPAEALKDQNDVAANDIACTEVDNEVVPRSVPGLPVNSNIIAESASHQRRKNNRNSKTKQKLDDGSKETSAAKVSTESGKPVSSEFELDPSAVQSRMIAEHVVQPSGQRTCSPSEETSSRVNNQWKAQQSRRMPRNQQVNNRAADRSHISEAVVWAPVRSQNKTEATNEASDKTSIDNVSLTVKGDNVGQNSMKSKRAEMERYVPKPVAKEMAQQGNVQQLQSSVNQNLSDDTVGRAEPSQNVENLQPRNSAIGNIGFTSDSRNGDNKLNKPLKAHGSWRLRGSVESASVQGLQDGSSSTSNPSKNVQKSTEQSQSSSSDTTSLKEQTKSSDAWNNSLGWNTLENSETAAHTATFAGKDQGGTGRGKRHPFKGHRSMGNNNDTDNRIANNESGNQDKYSYQPPASEVGQTDKSFGTKDNRGAVERTSHWQPKSQFHSVHNQHGNRSSGGRNATTEVNDAATKDSPSQDGIHLPVQNNKESREIVVQPPTDQPLSKEKSVAEAPNLGHHESRRERKAATFRGRPNSPNLTSMNTVEPAPPLPNVDAKHERPISAGFQKSGSQSNRSARGGPESRGDWSSAGQDNRQHSTSSNRERQKNSSSHYQPVGQYNNSNKSGNFEGPPADGFHNRGPKYRERNQGHSRHGGAANFYARQNGGSQL